jgi:DNA gyrase subunit B
MKQKADVTSTNMYEPERSKEAMPTPILDVPSSLDTSSLQYDENSIESYEGVDAIRKRPTMYIEELGTRGVFRLIQEVIGNSKDEWSAGRAKHIWVDIDTKTHDIKIHDDGAGIPIGRIDDCVTKIHTGGKFSTKAFKFAIGQNGVGLTAVNALSKFFRVDVWRDGMYANVVYRCGKVIKPLECIPFTDHNTAFDAMPVHDHTTGTTIFFKPDEEILGDFSISPEFYEDYFSKFSYINAGLTIHYRFVTKPEDEATVYNTRYAERGITDYLSAIIQGKKEKPVVDIIEIPCVIKRVIADKEHSEEMGIQVSFTWMSSLSFGNILSFVNGIQTLDGGYHVSGFKRGIASVIRDDLKSGEYISKKDPLVETITRDDFFEGFVAVLIALHETPLFDGQTKNKFTSQNYEPFASDVTEEYFREWSKLNKGKYKAIINAIILSAKARIAASKARIQVKATNATGISLLGIKKYHKCSEKDKSGCELFIVEGDSAGGSANQCRDKQYQAIYYMRGKPPNVYDAGDISKYVKSDNENNTIGNLFKILKCDAFGKIIIMADADYDGSHITALLLGLFYKYYREFISEGRVYIANPPLYHIKLKRNQDVYVANESMYWSIVTKAIMKFYTLGVYTTEKHSIIKDEQFYRQFLQYLYGYLDTIEAAGKQTNIHPQLLESLIQHYPNIKGVSWVRIHGYDFKGYTNEGLWVIEGVYHDIFHRITFSPFLWSLCEKLIQHMYTLRWVNLALFDKRTGSRIGPGFYEIAKTIDVLMHKSAHIKRFKGLGEMNPSQLWETTMNPESRVLTKVTLDMAKEYENTKALDVFIGSDIAGRKEYYKKLL